MTSSNAVNNSLTGQTGTGAFVGSISPTISNIILSGVNGVPAVLSNNPAPVTYPGTPSFFEVLGNYTNVLADTTQTINSVTPGGFNFVSGNRVTLTYSGAGTNDLSRFYLSGQDTNVIWSSANTSIQLAGANAACQYKGADQGGRITSSLSGSNGSSQIMTPSSGTATVTTLSGGNFTTLITNSVNINTTQNVTEMMGSSVQSNVTNSAANNISNITNMHGFNSTPWQLNGTGSGSSINITNLYGLRLQAPTITGTVVITNRFGISQEDAAASNVFAGPIATKNLSTAPAASQSSTLIVGTAYQNTLGYDVVLTVYLAVSAATAASILLGVGPIVTPTQQTIVSGLTLAALSIIPVTIYLPNNYYALLSVSGTITQAISGQQAMPV